MQIFSVYVCSGESILLYCSLSTRALFGQFCGPYSSVRPAKFENLVQHFVANMSREEKFDILLERVANKQRKPKEPRRKYAKLSN